MMEKLATNSAFLRYLLVRGASHCATKSLVYWCYKANNAKHSDGFFASTTCTDLVITAAAGTLKTYEFGSCIAKHHFSSQRGIYPFHQTMRKPGHYRINLGCLEGIDTSSLSFEVLNGAAIEVQPDH